MTEETNTETSDRILSEEEKKEINDAFDELDMDGNGFIDESEFVIALRCLKENPTTEEVKEALAAMDRNDDKIVTREEFHRYFLDHPLKPQEEQKQDLIDAFKRFDKNNDGFVKYEELRKALCCGIEPMSEEDVKELFDLTDVNEDGKISIEEFTSSLLEV